MKEKNFAKLMKMGSLLNIFIFLYPAFAVLKYFFYGTTGGVAAALIELSSMYLGLYVTAVICKKEYYFTTKLLSFVSVAVPVFLIGLLLNILGVAWSLLEMPAVGMFYIIGVVSYSKKYENVFTSNVLYFGAFLLVINLIAVNGISALNPMRIFVFLFVLAYILMTMLIKSEENIDQVFITRGVEIPEVQRSIRKQNAKAIIVLFAIILILFNIKDLVSAALKFIVRVYLTLSIFLLYLLSLLYPKNGEKDQSQGGMGPPELPFEPGEPNKLVEYLFTAIFIVISIYLIYKAAPKVIRAISAFIAYIKEKFTKIFKISDKDYVDDECIDIIEITKHIGDKKQEKKKKVSLNSLLKKTTNPAERIRLIYAIILNELKLKGVPITTSDTSGQIADKIIETGKFEGDIEGITIAYEKVRYGEVIPQSESVQLMEEGRKKLN